VHPAEIEITKLLTIVILVKGGTPENTNT
jgi:hypothetical protein